jgi:hypothetical protein
MCHQAPFMASLAASVKHLRALDFFAGGWWKGDARVRFGRDRRFFGFVTETFMSHHGLR